MNGCFRCIRVGLFSVVAFLSAQTGWSSGVTAILSDLDDTVKITHVGSAESIERAFLSREAFPGMARLYRELVSPNPSETRVFFVTGSPAFLEGKVKGFLIENQFPPHQVWLRDALGRPEIYDFKVSRMSSLMQERAESFIAFGDDTERDPEVYSTITERFPGRVRATYIRRISNPGAPLHKGQRAFFTAMDVAIQEMLDGRLSVAQAVAVGQEVLSDKRGERIVPRFAVCPKEDWLSQLLPAEYEQEEELQRVIFEIEIRVRSICLPERLEIPASPHESDDFGY